MKNLDVQIMYNAVNKAMYSRGKEILLDSYKFQAAMKDLLNHQSEYLEREWLIFAVSVVGVGKDLLKALYNSNFDKNRQYQMIIKTLIEEHGFPKNYSVAIVEALTSALDNSYVMIPISATLNSDDTIHFGGYEWQIIHKRAGEMLLLSKEITDIGIPYHKNFAKVSWAESTIREWLNTEFICRFSDDDRRRIISKSIVTEQNPWYKVGEYICTEDKIFLPDIFEIVSWFGDSGHLDSRPDNDWMDFNSKSFAIDDEYNSARLAYYSNKSRWWWLRSVGDSTIKAAYVNAEGIIFLGGEVVSEDGGGVNDLMPGIRPALRLKI